MLPITDYHTLSRLFHLNSEPWMNLEAYASESYAVHYKHVGDGATSIDLPALPPPRGLRALLAARSSCRRYDTKPLAIAVLGEVVGGAAGFTRSASIADGIEMQTRAAPSAGALYPLELYAACSRVTGVPEGLYHYAPADHAFEPLPRREPLQSALSAILLAEGFVRNANALIFLTAVFDRTQRKYGPRGYRYVLLEAGHIAQNICLLAAERGLGSLCVGGFVDHRTNQFLGVDGLAEAAIYAIALGYPT